MRLKVHMIVRGKFRPAGSEIANEDVPPAIARKYAVSEDQPALSRPAERIAKFKKKAK